MKFLKLGLLATLLSHAILVTSCTQTKKSDHLSQPNVLFISIDDLNDWVGPLSGNDQTLTPNLDRFAQQAVNFTKNYCPSPGCNPSRSALLTGLHTYTSGMYSNYQDWRKVPRLQQTKTIGQYFRENGYYTAGAGKIFHYGQVDTLGWEDYYPGIKKPMPQEKFPDKRPANMPPFKHMYGMFDWAGLPISDEETSDFESVNYISEQLEKKHDRPFFLACGIYRPHLPWYVPQKYFDRFPLHSIRLPSVLENDTADLGPVAKELISRGGNYHKHVVEAGQWKQAIQGYLASVSYADAMAGILLDNLARSSHAENTIVVLWSDHGWQLGEKMHWRKFALWENVIRSVLMIKVPPNIHNMPGGSANGQSTANPTSLMDIYPTLVDLCGLPPRKDFDGVTLRRILENPQKPELRPIVTTYDYGSYSIRYDHWHYIRYIDDSEELYDLGKDPEEWHNLAGQEDYADIKAQLSTYIPDDPVDLPEASLIPLQEHHIPPFKSKAYFSSPERKLWMKRFGENY